MLNTDPALFADLGYCLFPDVLDPQETATLRRMLDEALATPLPRHAVAHRAAQRLAVAVVHEATLPKRVLGQPRRWRWRRQCSI